MSWQQHPQQVEDDTVKLSHRQLLLLLAEVDQLTMTDLKVKRLAINFLVGTHGCTACEL